MLLNTEPKQDTTWYLSEFGIIYKKNSIIGRNLTGTIVGNNPINFVDYWGFCGEKANQELQNFKNRLSNLVENTDSYWGPINSALYVFSERKDLPLCTDWETKVSQLANSMNLQYWEYKEVNWYVHDFGIIRRKDDNKDIQLIDVYFLGDNVLDIDPRK